MERPTIYQLEDVSLIKQYLKWLSDNIQFRDDVKKLRNGHTRAQEYALAQLRAIGLCKRFIEESEENKKYFHDLLLDGNLKIYPTIWELFYKLYSHYL